MNKTKLVKFNNGLYEQLNLVLSSAEPDATTSTQYGFIIAGYCPSYVESIADDSLSARCGLQKGDLLIRINETNCCRATLKSILGLIKSSPSQTGLKLTVYRSLSQAGQNKKRKLTERRAAELKSAKKSSRRKLLNKLFKPSLWLSCAQQPLNLLLQPSTCGFSSANATQLNPNNTTYYSRSVEAKQEKSLSVGDTGYETLSRYDSLPKADSPSSKQNDFSIETVTNTTNSYSQCDLTLAQSERLAKSAKKQEMSGPDEQFNEYRTQLIGSLIEMEANFVSYLSVAVATFSRPLRGFFMKQQDYFALFQNIEKILVISENFLRSMDKWSAFDLYARIGQLYTQKLSLFKEAFTIYIKGYSKSKSLLHELKSHSKQFRLFLKEVQTGSLTLANLLDLPVVHLRQTLEVFVQIRKMTGESKRNPSEAPRIDSVIGELRKLLLSLSSDETMQSVGPVGFDSREDLTSTTFFMMNNEESSLSSLAYSDQCSTEENSSDESVYYPSCKFFRNS